ncbi:MFS transporter [Nocardia sp. NPDC058518]|uniref:MFS transporter n=1 Tax=Nocardia sp. NPDC058518 TaxID=3346534 RepID=UPI00364F657C
MVADAYKSTPTLIYIGQFLIALTGYASTIALTYVIISASNHDYAAVGAVSALYAVAALIGTLNAPLLIRKIGTRATIMLSAFGCATGQIGAWLCFDQDLLVAGAAAAVCSGLAAAPVTAAMASLLREAVPVSTLRASIGRLRTVRNVAIVAGLVAGSPAIAAFGAPTMLLADGLFKIAAGMVFLWVPGRRGQEKLPSTRRHAGFALLAGNPAFLLAACLEVLFQLCWGAATQVNAPALYESSGRGSQWLVLAAAPLVGAVFAGIYTSRVSTAPRLVPPLLIIGVAAAWPIAIAVEADSVLSFGLGMVGGAVMEYLAATWISAMGLVLGPQEFAALFAAQMALGLAVAPISRIGGGLLLEVVGPHTSMFMIGCLLASIPVLTLACRPLVRNDADIQNQWEAARA